MEKELREGTVGEYIVWNLFIKQKGIRSVVDVRDDEFFRKCDVDFLIEDVGRQFHWVEVKTDSMADRTHNFAYEKFSSKTYHTQGCFEKTKAEVIMYYVPGWKKVFAINVGLLRDYVHNQHLEERKMGDDAIGYLIPFEELARRNIVTNCYEV